MREGYSSLYKGTVHITTEFSTSHQATDYGNYKVKNPIYSPERLGIGKVTKIATTDKYNGIIYNDVLTIWVQYGIYEMCLTHGEIGDKCVNVGDTVIPGQQIYKTGNKGYSKGDHLHVQLKENGILIDPSVYTFNDKGGTLAPGAIPYSTTPPEAPEITELKKQVSNLQTQNKALQEDLTASNSTIAEKVALLDMKDKEGLKVEEERNTYKKERDFYMSENSQLVQQLDELKKRDIIVILRSALDFLGNLVSRIRRLIAKKSS